MNPKLAEMLPQFTMETLSQLDRGAVERRVNDELAQAYNNISRFPCRDGGKVEPRKVIIEVTLTPELKKIKTAVEVGGRQQEVDSFELSGIVVRAKVKGVHPDAETADVRMLCDIVNNRIQGVYFNPENNERPEQLELDLDCDEA